MARSVCIVALMVLASLAVASAQCIECKDCKGSAACMSMCKQSCAPTVNIEVCKGYGVQAGKDAATFACDLSRTYCGNLVEPRRLGAQRVTLQQCGNAAYGVCQSTANDPKQSPCGNMFNGAAKCSKAEFQKFYNAIVDEQCNQKVAVFDKPAGRR